MGIYSRTLDARVSPPRLTIPIPPYGDMQMDVLVSKLKSRFGVESELSIPRVPYREKIRKKVGHQLDEDKALDQMTMKEFVDPFRGSK